ncbi:Peptidoglycan/LPS O-acetylase OafA/YrhL, contains acyltransferase and SGNH-hydrolase domains [Massilia yuzhufengensis]|uniref:Peptidoglycan/LPS O-acetylase OafA/YrhL, contains acyltransferase and SGNH-hydrolase domains n=2 Tax=Massilia yuzhufengensis TaxID=1164594 RepID=A0A1I1PUG6_9BURK|nr:Peptidoglycan/LPS O-acetylase OafA/YrhL, contains acyltransferase and SGNH-hydrolase domains [Massilia yuzhufengensis]
MQPAIPTARIHGLDTLRALAVTLVVLHHYVLFVSDAPTFGWVGEIGWVGVDLFFALSGYLIGNQIFAALRSPGGFSLKHFYARRLLRTLPNYWVVLALYFLWPAFRGDAPLLPLWKYLAFVQNFALEPGSAFSHSWSLAIEEQFYLLLPAVALLGALWGGSLRLAWVAIALAFAAGMLVRAELWQDLVGGQKYQLYFYFKHIYYSSLCRFDELLAGVALALLRNHHPAAWGRLTRHGNLVGLAGLLVCAVAFWLFIDDRYGFAITVFGFPLLALGFSLLIASSVSENSLLRTVRVPGAGPLALWSYAIYLLHKQVCVLGATWMATYGYGAESPLTIVAMLALSVLTGWLLYKLVETPFMRLRERYVPSNAARPGQLTPAPR